MIPKNSENESQKVRLPWSASPTGIQFHQPYSENLGMRNPVKSMVPAILSTVSNQRLCPTQLDCKINRIRLKLHTLYATVPLTSQAVHFRVDPKNPNIGLSHFRPLYCANIKFICHYLLKSLTSSFPQFIFITNEYSRSLMIHSISF